MGLAQVQGALARLYTDQPFRERFFADPGGCGQAMGLDCDEAVRLAEVSRVELEFFARSLLRKRADEVSALLPLTCQLLGNQVSDLFARYAVASTVTGPLQRRADAIAFSAFVGREIAADRAGPRWAAELARYEACWLEASMPDTRCLVRGFRHSPAAMAWVLSAQEGAPAFQPTLAIWLRSSSQARLWYRGASFPVLRTRGLNQH